MGETGGEGDTLREGERKGGRAQEREEKERTRHSQRERDRKKEGRRKGKRVKKRTMCERERERHTNIHTQMLRTGMPISEAVHTTGTTHAKLKVTHTYHSERVSPSRRMWQQRVHWQCHSCARRRGQDAPRNPRKSRQELK